jgi:hypothetical protein
VKASDVNARTAPTARKRAQTDGRQIENLLFISVGLKSNKSRVQPVTPGITNQKTL